MTLRCFVFVFLNRLGLEFFGLRLHLCIGTVWVGVNCLVFAWVRWLPFLRYVWILCFSFQCAVLGLIMSV